MGPVTANEEWQLLLRNGVIAIGTVYSSLIHSCTMVAFVQNLFQMNQEYIDVRIIPQLITDYV